MVKITKVYTRRGDDGKTGTKQNRTSKNSLRIEAVGKLDELNSYLGWVVVLLEPPFLIAIKQQLLGIQNDLFDVGAFLCETSKITHPLQLFSAKVQQLEQDIEEMNKKLLPLGSFILPGGSEICARIHIARTVCRSAERTIVALSEEQNAVVTIIPFINRLSDWLFVSARYVLSLEQIKEKLWQPAWK